MDWGFLDEFPLYRPTQLLKLTFDRLHLRLQRGEAAAIRNLLALLDADPPRELTRKAFDFMVEACLEHVLIQLPHSPLVSDILVELMRRPEYKWRRSKEALLEAVYISQPTRALDHFTELIALVPDGRQLLIQALQGDPRAIRTLLNSTPRRALVAGLVERLLATPKRHTLLVELADSFQDLDWLSRWSPQCKAAFGQRSVRHQIAMELLQWQAS